MNKNNALERIANTCITVCCGICSQCAGEVLFDRIIDFIKNKAALTENILALKLKKNHSPKKYQMNLKVKKYHF